MTLDAEAQAEIAEGVALIERAPKLMAILDAVSPSVGVTARQGAGFGLGANLVGFPRM